MSDGENSDISEGAQITLGTIDRVGVLWMVEYCCYLGFSQAVQQLPKLFELGADVETLPGYSSAADRVTVSALLGLLDAADWENAVAVWSSFVTITHAILPNQSQVCGFLFGELAKLAWAHKVVSSQLPLNIDQIEAQVDVFFPSADDEDFLPEQLHGQQTVQDWIDQLRKAKGRQQQKIVQQIKTWLENDEGRLQMEAVALVEEAERHLPKPYLYHFLEKGNLPTYAPVDKGPPPIEYEVDMDTPEFDSEPAAVPKAASAASSSSSASSSSQRSIRSKTPRTSSGRARSSGHAPGEFPSRILKELSGVVLTAPELRSVFSVDDKVWDSVTNLSHKKIRDFLSNASGDTSQRDEGVDAIVDDEPSPISKRKRRSPKSSSRPLSKKPTATKKARSNSDRASMTPGGTRRATRRWNSTEVKSLLEGIKIHGYGHWSAILADESLTFMSRTSVDLKDKHRNLVKAGKAEVPL
mmetsp:Transcript_3655/g.11366  ORF Transcript_3655/g.11366 Transcript_3655/m.11366 type:complete len:469 (-) Transcript_3655:126-1532(-)